jgi:hypothetical protein
LTGAIGLDGLLFVVGSTTSGGVTEGVLMEIDAATGNVLSTDTYDAGTYNSFTSITTDGEQLYVAGVSGSSASHDQAVLLTYSTASTAPANLIVNGGFETNDLTGWTTGGDNPSVSAVSASYQNNDAPHHGAQEALIGGFTNDVTLSQSVATTAGQHYTVDFWLMNDAAANPAGDGSTNDFSATWNGTALMPTILNADAGSGYTEYQFDVTGAAGESTLQFAAQNTNGHWDLDDVSVRMGAPDTAQQMSDETNSVSGVSAADTLTVTAAGTNPVTGPTVTATAGAGTIEWQFEASNAQLDHLMGITQSYTVTDQNNSAVSQTVAVSVGGAGNDQFTFSAGVGADTMLNFSTISNAQGHYAGDTIELNNFTDITSVSAVLAHLSADSHGNAVVDLGNHDSITFQGVSVAVIQANASHIFQT